MGRTRARRLDVWFAVPAGKERGNLRGEMKSICLAACLLAPLALGAQSSALSNDAKAGELDAYVAKAVKDWNVAGLAIAVVKDGRVVFSKGYGVREVGKAAPVDTSTLFAIASTTKAMTAAS